MQRHMIELYSDNQIDDESKLKHIGHVLCNAMFYSYFQLKSENDKVNEG